MRLTFFTIVIAGALNPPDFFQIIAGIMKDFFENSINFWIGTRILLVFLLLYSFFNTFGGSDPLTFYGLASAVYLTFYMIFSGIMLYHELMGKTLPFLLRSLTGGMTLLQAVGVTIYIFFFSHPLLLFIPVWIFIFGLYDVYNTNRYRP